MLVLKQGEKYKYVQLIENSLHTVDYQIDWHWDGLIDFPAFGRGRVCHNDS